ncbi:type I polyketide synthase [Nocardia thailandica]
MTGHEPIAVIGLGCRFAGGIDSPAAYWRLLTEGGTLVGDLPEARLPHDHAVPAVGRALRRGAYLTDIAGFDAAFFGIPATEAECIDPQHRLAMEVAWESLQHAGIDPAGLAGSDTGVYIGIGSDDYGRRLLADPGSITAWTGIGAALCGAPNRISHALDLRGPSLAIDTACSSSLVAVHQAVSALRDGTIPLALAGGVMLTADAALSVVLAEAGVLAPDGVSKSFDAAADGYGRGEGCAFVVLERLSDAVRARRRVLAVIRGGAVRQDGRTNGIMTPSGSAQQHLARAACADAGVEPGSVDYVEAHGTGTRAGDPAEAAALAAVFGTHRPDGRPCLIGSVKPNIGHLEAAAGIAGLVKVVLALHHRRIPATRSATGPHPDIDWRRNGLALATTTVAWPDTGGVPRAGVASYGYGGTLCHVIVEAAPPPEPLAPAARTASAVGHLCPVSAASAAGLAAELAALAEAVRPGADLAAVCRTRARHRGHLGFRLAVGANDTDELAAALDAAAGAEHARCAPEHDPVWVFSGHGSQWAGMGAELLEHDRSFAAALAEVSPVFATEWGCPAEELLTAGDLGHTPTAQCAIFLVQLGLAAMWRAHGVRPAAVIGHSVGEVAAAVAAGALTAVEGARVICLRSRSLEPVTGRGAMVMVPRPFDEVAAELSGRGDLCAAVRSSFSSTVVSGTAAAVATLAAQWRARGLPVRKVDSDIAFHGPWLGPAAELLGTGLATLEPRPATIPLYTTALVDPRDGRPRDGAYWAHNLVAPVRFADAIAAAHRDGHATFLEISAHPVVAHSIGELGEAYRVLPTLRRHRPQLAGFRAAVAELYRIGGRIDWSALYPDGEPVDLPTTRWQRKTFWRRTAEPAEVGGEHDPASATLLGLRPISVNTTPPLRVWHTTLDRSRRPYPGDHPMRGSEIVPAAILLHTFAAAVPGKRLHDIALRVPVTLDPPRRIQVSAGAGRIALCSRTDGAWQTHTTARYRRPRAQHIRRSPVLWYRGEPLQASHVVDRLAALGVTSMGLHWQIIEAERSDQGLSARVKSTAAHPDTWATFLDAALSAASVVFPGAPTLRMPAHIEECRFPTDAPPAEVVVTVTARPGLRADVDLSDADGRLLASLTGVRYAEPDTLADTGATTLDLVWRPTEPTEATEPTEPAPGPRPPITVAGDDPLLRHAFPSIRAGADRPGGDAGVLVCAPRPWAGEPVEESVRRMVTGLFETARTRRGPWWCVTRGAAAPRTPAELAQTALWGAGRALLAEYPDTFAGVIDLPATSDAGDIAALAAHLRTGPGSGEDVAAVFGGRVHHLRGVPVPARDRPADARCDPAGTYAVLGATGALGAITAQWLVQRGARRLVLVGRRTPAPRRANPAQRALEAQGVTVRAVAADVTDPAALAAALDTEAHGLPPLRGVVHAAGAVDNVPVRDLRPYHIERGLAAKVSGTLALGELFAPGVLDFLILFSSAGQLLHLPGQPVYSAANAFVDGFARQRRALGDTGCRAVAWTSWRGLGMSTSSAAITAELAVHGTADLTASQALRAWEGPVSAGGANVAVLRVVPHPAHPPLLSEVATAPVLDAADPWTALDASDRPAALAHRTRCVVAGLLGVTAEEVPGDVPLTELGVDSLLSAVLRRELGVLLRRPVPATVLWHHPTIDAVAGALARSL